MIMMKPISGAKTVVTIRIDNDIWTKFRMLCIEKDVKYSHELEAILTKYTKQSKKKKAKEERNNESQT
jgi:uncharacterized protein (DUF4415 family)